MVRLPARLTSKLAKARIARIFSSAPPGLLIHCVDPADVLHPGSTAPVSHEKIHALMENSAPVIWIGGNEPLLHAGIGHFVRVIAESDHCIFLETDGTSLRRRIHEFQPLRRLFLTVRLDSLHPGDCGLAIEGLRGAHLSGFFTIIHSRVHEDFDATQLVTLRAFIAEKDVDGWLITAASSDDAIVRNAAEARRLIRSSFWRQLSEHVEESLLTQAHESRSQDAPLSSAESLHAQTREEARQEGVEIA